MKKEEKMSEKNNKRLERKRRKRWKKNALPMSLYTIRKESECRWPKNWPWIIDEYFLINLRYLKLFFSEYVVWPFGMIPICLSSLPGGIWPTIYTYKEKNENDGKNSIRRAGRKIIIWDYHRNVICMLNSLTLLPSPPRLRTVFSKCFCVIKGRFQLTAWYAIRSQVTPL